MDNPSFLCGGNVITVKDVMQRKVHFNVESLRQYNKFRDAIQYIL